MMLITRSRWIHTILVVPVGVLRGKPSARAVRTIATVLQGSDKADERRFPSTRGRPLHGQPPSLTISRSEQSLRQSPPSASR